ncbi:SGNH/GDSL hydrolase family protein [Leifsonia poae]|uniref:SGNH/GDSL hydrolase family protein n=1 Tax=Leifsonia poae TaxID=110933 RepID=UPI001CC03C18|nr:SGNH/GDSL hydrolase family protein [Leifsonia poae]
MSLLRADDRILFIGDSITDAERVRTDPADLGQGYARVVAESLAETRPELAIEVINRGISGDRAVDLQARWEEDCLDLTPTVVSLLVGVNDTWRRFDSNDPTSTEAFETSVRDLLTRARESLNPRFVLLEPFTLPVGPVTPEWRDDLEPRIVVIRALAAEFDAVLVSTDELFAFWATERRAAELLGDGVHPTPLGHELMAQAWLGAAA